jgi:asparagine synthase (glutamine-hydrolysing)
VPLGVFLSGGVDSSLVAAIASRSGKSGLKSFSIGFHSRVFDESRQARAVASYLGTEHYNYMLDETEAVGMIDDYFQYFDEPFADSSAIPTMLISKIARQHVTVALTGGDELFLGYGAYDWANRLDNPLLAATKGLIKNVAIAYGNNRLKRIASLLGNVTDRSLIRSHIFSQEQYLFSHEELSRLLPANYTPFQYCDPVTSRELTSSERQALFDLKYYLKDDLLVKVDRASMFSSLECRCPLLDKNVVALAMQIPEKYKRRGNVRKWILTQVLNDFLPANLIPQRKRGFSIPLSGWLKNQLKYLVDDSLSPEYVAHAGLVNFSEVKALLTRFHNGEEYLYNRIWCLVVMHKWLKEHASILP